DMAFVHLDTVLGSVFLYNCAPTENAFFLFITFERRNALIVICTTAILAYYLSINPSNLIGWTQFSIFIFHFSIFTFLFSFLFSFSDIWIFFCIFAKCEGVRLAR
ncbi:MAG: hypothetical protein IJL48_02110, partial [Bacteroidales bacterium]|nr:hypothetical protein [Bacteroidales bacterium]